MRDAGESIEDVFIDTRLPLHFVQRTGTRLNQLISPFWDDRPPAHRAVTVALGGLDVAIGLRLRRNRELQLGWRLALDAAELALACALAVRDDYEEAAVPAVPGCPLAVEAGGRLGWRGFVVPAVNLTVGTTVRRMRGHAPRTGTMAWQVAATAGGMGLAAYGTRRRRQELQRHQREQSAQRARAEVEGRNDVVMHETLIDELQRLVALVNLSTGIPSSTNVVGAWKAELAARSRAEYAYLGDELLSWQAATNAGRVDLTRLVRLSVPTDAAAIILGDDQAHALRNALDELDLVGECAVAVAQQGSAVILGIADKEITVSSRRSVPPTLFDPVPAAFCWSALWLFVAGARSREHVPRWASMGPAGLGLVAALVAHRAAREEDGRAPRGLVTAMSAALTLSSVAVQTRTMRNTHGEGGIPRYPFSLALRGFLLVALLSWRELAAAERSGVVAVTGATIGLGWALTPSPRSGRELVAELVWPLQSVTLGGTLVEAIERNADDLATEVRLDDERALAVARARGRAAALRYVGVAVGDAEAVVAEVRDRLDPDLMAETQRRLDWCRQRLDQALTTEAADVGAVEPVPMSASPGSHSNGERSHG